MNSLRILFCLTISILLLNTDIATAQTTVTIGTGSSSSSTRGPFQRADTNSSTVFSRWVQIYTATELATAGITSGVDITELAWELASSNVIIGSGDATLKVYIKNSSATAATADSWTNLIAGSTLAVDNAYNTTNNFPGANGWMPFTFSAPFTYMGGALEIAVDWDCSQVTTPAFSGNGALKFRWESVAPDFLVVKKTSSSSPSSTISDLKDERANIQITHVPGGCAAATNLSASNITTNSADLSWDASFNATSYNWVIVAAGDSATGTAIDSGTTSGTTDSTSSLSVLTSYDLYVDADCGSGTSGYAGPYNFLTFPAGQTTAIIGTGSSSSSTRGPFQRSDTNSSTVYSRFVHIYTASELAAAGITNGSTLTELSWELASSNVIIGSGDATLKVYIKNSSATQAMSDSWVNHIAGSTLAVDHAYNTTNNFPGANGWMPFTFSAPFTYTGDALEIAVDWDCSNVSTPAFSGDGAIKWRWQSTAPDNLVVKKTSSSSPSSTITDLKNERANIQIGYAPGPVSCPNDSAEPNDSTQDATNLMGGILSGMPSYRICPADDEDYFQINIQHANNSVRVRLENLSADLNVELIHGGAVVASSTNTGLSNELINYTSASAGTYYVRVFGHNGAFSADPYDLIVNYKKASGGGPIKPGIHSPLFKVEEVETGFQIYPNPADGQFFIDYLGIEALKQVHITLFDMQGRPLIQKDWNQPENGRLDLNIANLASGLYQLQIDNGKETQTEKIVIIH